MAKITTARMRRITLIPCIHSFHLWQSGANNFLGFGRRMPLFLFDIFVHTQIEHTDGSIITALKKQSAHN
jgi:hypothetical protein